MARKSKNSKHSKRPKRRGPAPGGGRKRDPGASYSITVTPRHTADGSLEMIGLAVPIGRHGEAFAIVNGREVPISRLTEHELIDLLTPEDGCPLCLEQAEHMRQILAEQGIFAPPADETLPN